MNNLGLGTYRYILSLLVLISHLWQDMIHGPAAYAVYGFYVLSGFLMTLILNEKYGFKASGIARYLKNRALRIYPVYWLACAFGLIVYTFALSNGINASSLNPAARIPEDTVDFILNIALNPISNPEGRLVSVSHALGIELGAYILILFFGRNTSASFTMAICSLIAICAEGFSSLSFVSRYNGFMTSMLPFATGALLYHYKDNLKFACSPKLSLFAWIINGVVWLWNDQYPWTVGLYVSIFFSAWVTLSLYQAQTTRLDKFLGDLSYPVYLLHTSCGILILCLADKWESRSFTFMCISFAVTTLLSVIVIKYFDPLIIKFKSINNKQRGHFC